jgi:anti-sigma factor (TIGR02949 family)
MKTHCDEIRANLGQFLDGDLSGQVRERFAAHLEGCAECREELRRERQVEEAVAELPRVACPDRVLQRISEATAGQEDKTSLARRFRLLIDATRRRPLPIGLTLVGALVLVMLLTPRQETIEPTQFSEDEIQTASKQATWTLTYVAQTINKAQDKTMEELLKESLRSMIRTRLKDAVQENKGG